MEDIQRKSPQYLVIDARHEGQRLDNFLRTCLKGVPRTRIYRSVRRGEVRVNMGRIDAAYRLRRGDVVRVPPLRCAQENRRPAVQQSLLKQLQERVLYEDERVLILNKPAGVAVHGGSGQRYGIIEAVRALYPKNSYLELVHRLDRDTSGCLLIAKRRSALRRLHAQLRGQEIEKRYLALVRGRWRGGERRIELRLRKNVLRSGERVVCADKSGRQAITDLRPLAVNSVASLMEAIPVTGRMHQIRYHAAAFGYPLAGDPKYGDRDFNQDMRTSGLKRLFLHAASITYARDKAQPLQVVAPLGEELCSVLHRIGLTYRA